MSLKGHKRPLQGKESLKRYKNIEIEKISINYTEEMWNREETIIDDIFSYTVTAEILNDDYEPHNLNDCRQRSD